jgi:hypothetical protein
VNDLGKHKAVVMLPGSSQILPTMGLVGV